MKKLLCILLAVVLCLSICPVSAFAEGENIIVTPKTTKSVVSVGDTFEVNFNLTKNTGFVTLGLQVSYDSSVFEIVCPNHASGKACAGVVSNKLGIQNGVGSNGANSQYHTKNPYLIQWAYGTATSDVKYTGNIATLTFKVKKAPSNCKSTITVNVDQASNYAESNNLSFVGGSTTLNVHGATTTTVKKATTSANGSIIKTCNTCKKQISNTTVYCPKTYTLSATSYTYDGKVKKPAVTVKNAAGKVIAASNYTVTYASGRINAGTYNVTVAFKGNYSGSKVLSFKINPASAAKFSVKLGATSYTYNGKAKTPSVVVKTAAGKTLTKNTDYNLTYATGRTNVGTYKVTVKFKGNYTGTKTASFKINAASASKFSVKLGATSYTYNGKVKTPGVVVKTAAGKTLKNKTDYTVTYAKGRKNVGTYKVTVKFKGNYTGTKSVNFVINPVNTTVKSLNPGSKRFTVKWAKKTTQTTGYQIQYATASSFKGAKNVDIAKNKTVSSVVKGLKGNKKYFVRVRTYKTVSGKKYYSAWSPAKNVTTKK